MPEALFDLWRGLLSSDRLWLYLTIGWVGYVLGLGLWFDLDMMWVV